MVPVGRLTLVRTFAKSELIRAMSFVAIPGLVGPMLGPVAGGLIVGYFHWRLIFFLNIPIGIFGLLMVAKDIHQAVKAEFDVSVPEIQQILRFISRWREFLGKE